MKHLLLTTIAAVVLVGCGESKLPDISIHEAAFDGNIEAVKQHLAVGTDVNAKDIVGATPLDAAIMGKRTETADLLRKHGGISGAEDSVHVAAELGNIEAVKQHLATGGDENAKNAEGRTPLHYAAVGGYKEIAELLIAKGANVNANGRHGFTPLHLAASGGQKEVAELLIARDANVNAKTDFGLTPLIHAASNGHKEIAELLISEGADVNARNNKDSTPLDWAIRKKHTETADLLRKHGAKTGEELKAAGK